MRPDREPPARILRELFEQKSIRREMDGCRWAKGGNSYSFECTSAAVDRTTSYQKPLGVFWERALVRNRRADCRWWIGKLSATPLAMTPRDGEERREPLYKNGF